MKGEEGNKENEERAVIARHNATQCNSVTVLSLHLAVQCRLMVNNMVNNHWHSLPLESTLKVINQCAKILQLLTNGISGIGVSQITHGIRLVPINIFILLYICRGYPTNQYSTKKVANLVLRRQLYRNSSISSDTGKRKRLIITSYWLYVFS